MWILIFIMERLRCCVTKPSISDSFFGIFFFIFIKIKNFINQKTFLFVEEYWMGVIILLLHLSIKYDKDILTTFIHC